MSFCKNFEQCTCNICGEKGKFVILNVNPELPELTQLRENIICEKCGSISRDRMVIFALQQYLNTKLPLSLIKANKDFKILDCSATRGHPQYLDANFKYYNIWYEPEMIDNSSFEGRIYGDIQNLEFSDCYIDSVISSDVFEHVRLYKKGLSEVFRVLKPGGIFILTVPFLGLEKRNMELVETLGEKDVFLAPPQYHDSNTLVYRLYGGLDLIPLLWRIGFYVKFIETEIEDHAISWQNIILCQKPLQL